MIKVEVEDYCQECLDFTPDLTKPERVMADDGQLMYTDTIVRCKYHKRCAGITRYLQSQAKEEVSG